MNVEDEKNKLYEKIIKEISKSNQRISKIEKEFGENSWALKKLIPRLSTDNVQAISKNGRIKINKEMSIAQLRAIDKAIQNFLNSETSTIKGIKKVRNRTINTLRKMYKNDEIDLDYEEAEVLYEVIADDDYKLVFREMTPSKFWQMVNHAVKQHWSKDDWIEKVLQYIKNGNDEEMVEALQKLYDKLIYKINKKR